MVMASTQAGHAARVPEGFRAIPIHAGQGENPLRVCVLARAAVDPVGGAFVLLRDLADASVFLGCIVDANERVWDWLELWVQNLDRLPACFPRYREHLSNDALDARWMMMAEAFRELDPENSLRTGWESNHPPPLVLDLASAKASQPLDPDSGKPWKLCQDDGLLRGAGLPAYSTSVFRYWHADKKFVPVTAGAPENEATIPLAKAFERSGELLPFNPQAGLMMARRHAPIALDDYADVLSGKAWKGVEDGKQPFALGGVYAALQDPKHLQESGAYLFLGKQRAAGRVVEIFHLKLHLLAEAIRLSRAFVQRQQVPFLNLAADSFRVRLGETGAGLPFLWTAKVDLTKPSQAIALPVETSEFKYFLPAKGTRSIYLPESLGATVEGEGTVRIRKLLPPESGRMALEGTLVTETKLNVSPHDLMWLRLPLSGARVDLYGHVYTGEGMAQGEVRFRTLPQRISEADAKALRAAEGLSFSRAPFEFVPMLSSPCDLYSLGVLAVRLLLTNEGATLPVALDEVFSLARQAAQAPADKTASALRIRALFEEDARWHAALGPHRLLYQKGDAQEAAKLLPMELWWDLLAEIIRLFPGLGPDSYCRDFGDAPGLALERVFDQALANFEKLLLRTRSLIVIDWKFNREIHSAINTFLDKAL